MGNSALDISNLSSHWALFLCFEKVLIFEFMQMETVQGNNVSVTNKGIKAESVFQLI